MKRKALATSRLPARLISLGLALACVLPLLAGTSSDLKGRVTDRSGNPLPGATVTVRNDLLAVGERGAVTDARGSYLFRGLLPGPGYRVRASLPTFAPIEFSDVALEAGGTATLDIVLRPASEVQETVRVQGHASVVQPESVTTSTTFTSTFISGLPVLGRDYQDILTLAPGVTDVNHTGNPNIHGARDTDVVTLVDGVSTTDPFSGYYGQNLNIESIAEIEVITSGATAEFSRAQGGFANIITKSGSNEFAGTFKLFVRSNRLDGAGAGVDPPELSGGFGGAKSFAELSFTDLKPYLSLSGAVVKDRLWYFVSGEYIQVQTPVNALTQAFVTGETGYREFGKLSWQIAPAHRLAFSAILDLERDLNQGIDSLRDARSGYTFQRGGPTLTLQETAIFKPTLSLESTASWFDNRFSVTPTMSPDTNGNGILYIDRNHDGILEPKERDPGEDWDFDQRYDISEKNGRDMDGDGRVSLWYRAPCEGSQNEDVNCNGILDREVDLNDNGVVDPNEDTGIPCPIPYLCPDGVEPGTAHNGKFDTEDRNHNGQLDVVGTSGYTPFPFWQDKNGNGRIDPGEYQAPLPPDQDLFTDQYGRTTGPWAQEYHDDRKRFTLKEDLSFYVPELWGSHEVKAGAVLEHEGFDRANLRRAVLFFPRLGPAPLASLTGAASTGGTVVADMGIPANARNSAGGDNLGLYLEDSYKPIPNLTLGLGVRVDLEDLRTNGFTFFDPRAERRRYDSLLEASGVDINPLDLIDDVGLCADPVHSCTGGDAHLAAIQSTLRELGFRSFTRHNLDIQILAGAGSGIPGTDQQDPNVLIRLGLRPRQPQQFRITNANLAPRLSLSWDPWADGKSKVFSTWGRYYDKLFLNSILLEQGPDTVTRLYAEDNAGYDHDTGAPDYRLGRAFSQSPLSVTQVDRNLATPYVDEWTTGFQRELAPELSLGIRYIRRDYRDQLQDIDINHHTVLDPHTGQPADRIGLLDCDRVTGTCQNLPNGIPDLYIENPFFNRVLRLGNYNAQTYRGLEAELVRRLSRKWQLEASYTYSIARGDAETYLSEIGDDPSLAEFEPGYLDYDQRHVFKVNAISYLPGDWQLGWTAQWSSGLPFSYELRADDSDDAGYFQSRLIYGQVGPTGHGYTRESRNFHRNLAAYLFNARLQKFFVLGKATASAFFEVYNLLNADTLRVNSVQQISGCSGRGEGIKNCEAPFYTTLVGTRDFGRRFQLGMQIDF